MELQVDDIVAAGETYDSMIADIAPMLREHWEELALFKDEIPLDPKWESYRASAQFGFIRGYGVRIGPSRRLIGYAIFQVLERHAHYAHRWAINDIIWVHPDHRNFGVGTALCECFEKDLREGGPIVIHVETKAHAPALAVLLQSRGYGLTGASYAKRFA